MNALVTRNHRVETSHNLADPRRDLGRCAFCGSRLEPGATWTQSLTIERSRVVRGERVEAWRVRLCSPCHTDELRRLDQLTRASFGESADPGTSPGALGDRG